MVFYCKGKRSSYIDHFPKRLSLVAPTPAQAAGEIIAGTQGYHRNPWLVHKWSFICRNIEIKSPSFKTIRTQNVQNPADRPVSPANKNNDILNFPKHLKAGLEMKFDKHEYVRRRIKLIIRNSKSS